MRNIWLIASKEFRFYTSTLTGYIIIAVFAVTLMFFFLNDFFVVGVLSMTPFFNIGALFCAVFIAALSMRSFASEKRSNTIEILLTLPLTIWEIVVGKWLGIMLVLSFALALTLPVPAALLMLGPLHIPTVLSGYIGLLLFGFMLASIGIYISMFTRSQIAALLITALIYSLLLILNTSFLLRYIPGFLQSIIVYFSPFYHLDSFIRGVIAFRSIAYFLISASAVLWYAQKKLESSKI